jgi:hypothetical protein
MQRSISAGQHIQYDNVGKGARFEIFWFRFSIARWSRYGAEKTSLEAQYT